MKICSFLNKLLPFLFPSVLTPLSYYLYHGTYHLMKSYTNNKHHQSRLFLLHQSLPIILLPFFIFFEVWTEIYIVYIDHFHHFSPYHITFIITHEVKETVTFKRLLITESWKTQKLQVVPRLLLSISLQKGLQS